MTRREPIRQLRLPELEPTVHTRCTRCGPLSRLDMIARHNIACANTGERAYARPAVPSTPTAERAR